MKTTLEIIRRYKPCLPAKEWAAHNPDPKLAWETCPNLLWMAWIAVAVGVDQKLIIRTACECAKTVLHIIPEGVYDPHPRKAVETVEAFLRGEASLEDVDKVHTDVDVTTNRIWMETNPYVNPNGKYAAAYTASTTCDNCSIGGSYVLCAVIDAAMQAARDVKMDPLMIASIVRGILTWDVVSQHIPKE